MKAGDHFFQKFLLSLWNLPIVTEESQDSRQSGQPVSNFPSWKWKSESSSTFAYSSHITTESYVALALSFYV
jgi:hypothetical protein